MISVTREDGGTAHRVRIGGHEIVTDFTPAPGGTAAGPDPHDLYDAALGACKALTVLWYAQRNAIPVEDIEVLVHRDSRREREGVYRLDTTLSLGGPLSEEQRETLLGVAARCPVHRLMTAVTTEIATVLAE